MGACVLGGDPGAPGDEQMTRNRRNSSAQCVFAALLLSIFAGPLAAQEVQAPKVSLTKLVPDLTPVSDYTGELSERSTILGDVGGERQSLYEGGVTLDAVVTQVDGPFQLFLAIAKFTGFELQAA